MMTTKRANRFHRHTAIFVGLFHLGAVVALFMFDWKALVVAVALWWISASLGVGMGFHRQLTHRSYKTPKLVEYFLTVCGSLALEGGHILWVVTHRIHHAHTDVPGDPHTPRDGGWWSHNGSMLVGPAQHHAYPSSARHGLAWCEIDLNWWGIRVMQFLRLARAIKLVSGGNRAATVET